MFKKTILSIFLLISSQAFADYVRPIEDIEPIEDIKPIEPIEV